MTKVKSYQCVFFFSDSSVPEFICMAGRGKKIRNRKDLESAMLPLTSNANYNYSKSPPESRESILTPKHLCLSYLEENLLIQIGFCQNPHALFLHQLLLTSSILHFALA